MGAMVYFNVERCIECRNECVGDMITRGRSIDSGMKRYDQLYSLGGIQLRRRMAAVTHLLGPM